MSQLLKVIESPSEIPSKEEVRNLVSGLVAEFERVDAIGRVHSADSMLRCYAAVKSAEELVKTLKSDLEPIARDAFLQVSDKKTATMYGVKFTIKDNPPEYDFSKSEDWKAKKVAVEDLEAKLKSAKESLKATEKLLIAEGKAEELWSNGQSLSASLQ